jgi:FkbM family methyltransferase
MILPLHTLPKIFRRLGIASCLNITAWVRLGEKQFLIPLLGELGFNNLAPTEPWMTSLLLRLAPVIHQQEGIFVDVGVNIGQTLLKLRSVFPDFRYVGFEPNPSCVNYVTQLIKANAFTGIKLFPVGISDRPAILELQFFGEGDVDSCASMIKEFRPDEKIIKSIQVPVFPVGDLDFGGVVRFLKIDVEGAELEVMRGCLDFVRRDRPIILMEILPAYQADNAMRLDRQKALEAIMSDLDYSCLRVRKDASNGLESLQWLDSIEIHGDLTLCDYLWVPASRRDEIVQLFA